jgi:hypothetical protein
MVPVDVVDSGPVPSALIRIVVAIHVPRGHLSWVGSADCIQADP